MANKTREEWRILKNTSEDGTDFFEVQKGQPLESSPDTLFWIHQSVFKSLDKATAYVSANRIVSKEIVYDSSAPVEEED